MQFRAHSKMKWKNQHVSPADVESRWSTAGQCYATLSPRRCEKWAPGTCGCCRRCICIAAEVASSIACGLLVKHSLCINHLIYLTSAAVCYIFFCFQSQELAEACFWTTTRLPSSWSLQCEQWFFVCTSGLQPFSIRDSNTSYLFLSI